MSSFTTQPFATSDTYLTPLSSPPTNLWSFSGETDAGALTLSANVVCDVAGNANDQTTSVPWDGYPLGPTSWSLSTKDYNLYDLDENGAPDMASLNARAPFNSSIIVPDQALIQIDGANVTNKLFIDDGNAIDPTVLVRFNSPAIVSTAVILRSTGPWTVAGIGFPFSFSASSSAFTSKMPLFMTSVTGNMGSNAVTVTVWQAKSPHPPVSAFGVQSTYPFDISGSTGTPTLTSITLTLNASIRSVAEAVAIKIYMVPEVYNAASQGYPLWRPLLINITDISRVLISRVGTGAWDTLTFTFVNAVSVDDVFTSILRIQSENGVTYTVTDASRLSSTQVRYTISQTCANSSVSCVDTSPNITYNLTIGSLSLTGLTTEYETVAPVFVGAAAAIGSTKLRVLTSESIVGFSPSTAFTGATVTAQSGSGSEYSLTLSRSVKETDLSLTWLESDLVDALGNEATESALVFSVKATVHDDDGNGLITRLRLTTNRPHVELSSSAAFRTIPSMTLGSVTRVSSTVSDIAITNGVALGSSVSVEYVSHSSARLVLSSDTRGGLEIPLTVFPAESDASSTSDTGDADFSDLSTGIRALLISAIVAAFVLGIGANMFLRSSSSKKSQGRAYRYSLPSDAEHEATVEMGETVM